jgi:hypothetical protein
LRRQRRESLRAHALGRVGGCRIGAENESSRLRAQQRRRVIQVFVRAGA